MQEFSTDILTQEVWNGIQEFTLLAKTTYAHDAVIQQAKLWEKLFLSMKIEEK